MIEIQITIARWFMGLCLAAATTTAVTLFVSGLAK